LAGLRLFDIKCAWFNEEQYCEFFPRALLSHAENLAALGSALLRVAIRRPESQKSQNFSLIKKAEEIGGPESCATT
jgi:hypothetical protein